ncbi:MAG TPA: hypothetical protein VG963_16545 [Polyangiaceae bacterium]|nr:hypothetical protein [Polyangiaceae bacterium]
MSTPLARSMSCQVSASASEMRVSSRAQKPYRARRKSGIFAHAISAAASLGRSQFFSSLLSSFGRNPRGSGLCGRILV